MVRSRYLEASSWERESSHNYPSWWWNDSSHITLLDTMMLLVHQYILIVQDYSSICCDVPNIIPICLYFHINPRYYNTTILQIREKDTNMLPTTKSQLGIIQHLLTSRGSIFKEAYDLVGSCLGSALVHFSRMLDYFSPQVGIELYMIIGKDTLILQFSICLEPDRNTQWFAQSNDLVINLESKETLLFLLADAFEIFPQTAIM